MSPEARRAQLVDLGVQLLVAEPLENLTVLRVADLAGVSRALVFHYFPTVRELHIACLEAAAQRLVETIEAAISAEDSTDPLRDGLRSFADYLGQQPTTFLAMAGYSTTDSEFGGVFEAVRQQLIDLIVAAAGVEADPHYRLLYRGWVAFVEASIMQWLAEPTISRERLLDLLIDVHGDVIAHRGALSGETEASRPHSAPGPMTATTAVGAGPSV